MLNKFITQLQKEFSNIKFINSDTFRWDPQIPAIYYSNSSKGGVWTLLHEVGHMVLEHKEYKSDFALLKMETQAWQKAKELAAKYKLAISQEYIEKCLDSYRDWLYQRSSCRECSQAGLEITTGLYKCINCNFRWKVSPERFCRVYRKSVKPEIRS